MQTQNIYTNKQHTKEKFYFYTNRKRESQQTKIKKQKTHNMQTKKPLHAKKRKRNPSILFRNLETKNPSRKKKT